MAVIMIKLEQNGFSIQQCVQKITEPQHDKTKNMACAPSEESDQLGHLPSLIRVFAVRSMGSWPSVSSYGQQRLWSDWVDAQADPSFCWAQRSFCWFCHEAAQLSRKNVFSKSSLIWVCTICIWAMSWENLPYANNKGTDQPTQSDQHLLLFATWIV